MNCRLSNLCVNYPSKCLDCQTISEEINTLPHYEKRKPPVHKFKIFFGNHTLQTADDKLNQWLKENPSVRIIEWRYDQARMGDHSICIQYEEG